MATENLTPPTKTIVSSFGVTVSYRDTGHQGMGGYGYCVLCGARPGGYRAENYCQGGW